MKVKDPIEELKSTKLWVYLNKIDSDYALKSVKFLKSVKPLLSSIIEHFPYYTRHDAHHGFQVINRMEDILKSKCLQKGNELSFSAEEVFLLICSAYGHDMGMTVFPNEEDKLLEVIDVVKDDKWQTHPKLQEYLRSNHSKRGGIFIREHFQSIGLPESLIGHLDKLMMAHNLSINELEAQLGSKKRHAAGAKEIDLAQLACILCIADSLEFSDTRVIDGVLQHLKEKINVVDDVSVTTSYRENMKHVCIGDNVAISKKDGKIIFSGSFLNADVLHLAHQTIDLIENWIRDYCDIDYGSVTKRLRIRSDLIVRTLDYKYDFVRIGVRIKKDNIIGLISSQATWLNDPALVIRELLQNSVEACRYRKYHSSIADNYSPQIEVNFDKKNKKVTISDNGCGMTRNTILNNFLTVGNSRSLHPTYSSQSYHSLARFGIGFWSVFTISKKAHITTAPFEYLDNSNLHKEKVLGQEFEISIDEFKDYTVFKPVEIVPGTKIELLLKEEINVDDIPIRLNYHISCSEIPISIKKNYESYSIPKELRIPSVNEYFKTKATLAMQHNIERFSFKSDLDEIEFKLYIFYRQISRATFLLPDMWHSIFQIRPIPHEGFSRVGVCGFLSNFGSRGFCFELDHVGGFRANNKNPKGISFTLNRNSIIESEKSREFSDHIFMQVHKAYKKFLSDTDSYSTENIYLLNKESRIQHGSPGSANNSKEIDLFRTHFPDLLVFKFFKIEKGKNPSTCEIIFADVSTVCTLKIVTLSLASSMDFVNRNMSSDEKISVLYSLLSQSGEFEGMFLVDGLGENKILEEFSEESYIKEIRILLEPQRTESIFLTVVDLTTISFLKKNTHYIGLTRGFEWVGTIYQKKIDGANYFIKHQQIIVKKDSEVSKHVVKLFNEGQHYALCTFIYLLDQARQGFIDESVKKYI